MSHISHKIREHYTDIFSFFRPAHDIGAGEVVSEIIGSRSYPSVAFQLAESHMLRKFDDNALGEQMPP